MAKHNSCLKCNRLLIIMKTSTVLFLLTTAFVPTSLCHSSNQHSQASSAACSPMRITKQYIKDLNAYPTQSDIYMVQAQLLTVDSQLQCPTVNGILDSEKPASDICKKNQDLKNAIEELRFSNSKDKRSRVKELITACDELSDMLKCDSKVDGIV